MQSSGATKSGNAPAFLPLDGCLAAGTNRDSADLFFARASAASPRFEFQTASAFPGPDFAVMNGFGALPLPSAICRIVRPEARIDRHSECCWLFLPWQNRRDA